MRSTPKHTLTHPHWEAARDCDAAHEPRKESDAKIQSTPNLVAPRAAVASARVVVWQRRESEIPLYTNPYPPPYQERGHVAHAARGRFSTRQLVEAATAALRDAQRDVHRLAPAVFEVAGMSGYRTRMFYNNLLARLPGAHYLEVGSWRGSTLIAALANNTDHAQAVAIDNWSEFYGSSEPLRENVQRVLPEVRIGSPQLRVLEQDVFAIDFAREGLTGWADVYLYDGSHEPTLQEREFAVVLDQNVLRRPCLVVVDDWVSPNVSLPTLRAMEDVWQRGWHAELATQVDPFGNIVQSTRDMKNMDMWNFFDLFWNGMLVLVLG